jgi:2'-5' RNA ligase
MYGITLSTRSEAKAFWALVDEASAFESAPSVRALNYAPHLTVTRYAAVDEAQLLAALEAFEGEPAFSLTFERIATFETEPLVLWLAPRPDRRLIAAQARVNVLLDPALCDPHYRPGAWRPHLTLAAAVGHAQRDAARRFAARPLEPFSLTFDVVDCLSWPPVRVLGTREL